MGATILLVGKKDRDKRLYSKYRCLSRVTIENWHPLSRTDDLFDRFGGTRGERTRHS